MTVEFPHALGPGADADDPYGMWDAAYVLGSLSSTERRDYELHLGSCRACRTAVAELSGVPALLGLMDRDEMAATTESVPDPPPLRPEVLDGLLARVNWRRRRSRWMAATVTAAAAVVLAVGVSITVRPTGVDTGSVLPKPVLSALSMTPVDGSEFTASFTLTGHEWGTGIDMVCTYRELAGGSDGDSDDDDTLAMVAIGRDGSRAQLATWLAKPGVAVVTSGSTAMPIGDIAAVQVVGVDSGAVLLQRNL